MGVCWIQGKQGQWGMLVTGYSLAEMVTQSQKLTTKTNQEKIYLEIVKEKSVSAEEFNRRIIQD